MVKEIIERLVEEGRLEKWEAEEMLYSPSLTGKSPEQAEKEIRERGYTVLLRGDSQVGVVITADGRVVVTYDVERTLKELELWK